MKNPMETLQRSPDIHQTGGDMESKEKLNELEAIPIFRNNDLYAELFPEIKPAFEKGEEPEFKKILEEVLKYKNKKVIFDNTCKSDFYTMIENPSLDMFPFEMDIQEIPIIEQRGKKYIDVPAIIEALKERFGIDVQIKETIDSKITQILGGEFSKDTTDILFKIVKEKNNNIKQIYILLENLTDHAYDRPNGFSKEKVLPTLIEETKSNFGLEPILLPTISESAIKEGDLIIVDRHNPLVRGDIIKQKPTQFATLPLETEISNNERYLENKKDNDKLVILLRKEFEKKF